MKNSSNNTNSLTDKDVQHVASLAKLALTKDDIKKFQKQLSEIIHFVAKLNELDTQDIEPTSQVTGQENIFRDDVVKKSLTQKEALANTKRKYKGYFVVDAIFD
ncbi:Asp-tRNA(Asn)/Glu-tRNA(Gln) amidotransferase subunit GatC [Candidatus Gottesmanbacteria bacterium]|nr:Asp-tRNA(Asn)/Glu-tRNA(Gln) amidotransferase subunit GatC [Candidatus Gottesmanbacteria bacterium]